MYFGNRRVCTMNEFVEGTVIEFPCTVGDVYTTLYVKRYFKTEFGEKDSETIAELPIAETNTKKGPVFFVSDIIAKAEEKSGQVVEKPVYVDCRIANLYYYLRK